jgi:hypothetical protein
MNTDELIKESKAKFDHNLAKHYLKEKYQSKLIFADQGGLWKATPDFLSFLSSLTLIETVILDLHENPIKVNKESLSIKAHSIYHNVMTEWHEEWTELRKKR